MKKNIAIALVLLFSLYGASSFIGKTWYYIKVLRTTERILKAQSVQFKF
tara:strand:- start:3069 stop:3215 length:147 start_codon:yes stop_codon:yes gene_type:complete